MTELFETIKSEYEKLEKSKREESKVQNKELGNALTERENQKVQVTNLREKLEELQ